MAPLCVLLVLRYLPKVHKGAGNDQLVSGTPVIARDGQRNGHYYTYVICNIDIISKTKGGTFFAPSEEIQLERQLKSNLPNLE